MDDILVPLSVVMNTLVNLCPKCRRMVRAYIKRESKVLESEEDARLNELLKNVSEVTLVPIKDLVGKSRRPHVINARRIFIERARAFEYSFPVIGRRLGKHHTTIMHTLKGKNHAPVEI
jgi:chromosomal replication initiation ATPase DnaA